MSLILCGLTQLRFISHSRFLSRWGAYEGICSMITCRHWLLRFYHHIATASGPSSIFCCHGKWTETWRVSHTGLKNQNFQSRHDFHSFHSWPMVRTHHKALTITRDLENVGEHLDIQWAANITTIVRKTIRYILISFVSSYYFNRVSYLLFHV